VAYLVEDGPEAQEMLDAIFADAISRWGGRYNLVVPCHEGRLLAGYENWLRAYDPDLCRTTSRAYDELARDLQNVSRKVEGEFRGTYSKHALV
jgi:hypothetical protein